MISSGRPNVSRFGVIYAGAQKNIGPAGLTNGESPELRILEDANTAALIGKLEDTEEPAFEIGEATSYECPVAGTLYLGINDTSTGDNEGEFWVTVTYVPPPD